MPESIQGKRIYEWSPKHNLSGQEEFMIEDPTDGISHYCAVNDVLALVPTTQGTSLTWSTVTSPTPVVMQPNSGYLVNSTSEVFLTLPSASKLGDRLIILGRGTGLWRVTQNAGQQIVFSGSVSISGVNGYLRSTAQGDIAELFCTADNSEWMVNSSAFLAIN